MKKDVKREGAIKKSTKKRAARRKKKVAAFFLVFLFMLLCIGAVLCATILFPIKNIVVDGNSIYTHQQIIAASTITEDDNIIMLSETTVKNRISKALPYSGEIIIEKVFPDTVKITVNTAVPKYYTISEKGYYVLDSEFKVVEETAKQPTDCTYIKATPPENVALGEKMSFSAEENALLQKLAASAEDKNINVTGYSISDPLDVRVTVDNKIVVNFGSDVDIERKLIHFAAMYEKLSEDAQGIANLSMWTSSNTTATFRDVKIDLLNFCELKAS